MEGLEMRDANNIGTKLLESPAASQFTKIDTLNLDHILSSTKQYLLVLVSDHIKGKFVLGQGKSHSQAARIDLTQYAISNSGIDREHLLLDFARRMFQVCPETAHPTYHNGQLVVSGEEYSFANGDFFNINKVLINFWIVPKAEVSDPFEVIRYDKKIVNLLKKNLANSTLREALFVASYTVRSQRNVKPAPSNAPSEGFFLRKSSRSR
jgi:hypothetical protein